MPKTQHRIRFSLAVLALVCLWGVAGAAGPANVLVLVNQQSESSKLIAEYYVSKRAIPRANVCAVDVPDRTTISRRGFEDQIRRPAADCLRTAGLQDQILYIVTTSGLPLIVEGDTGPVGDMASVDSELALLYSFLVTGDRPNYGKVENSFFASRFDPGSFSSFERNKYQLYLVSRLVGATPVEAFLRVDRGLAVRNPVGRVYFDLPAQRRTQASLWARSTSAWLEQQNIEVVVEESSAALASPSSVLGYCFFDRDADTLPVPDWVPGGLALSLSPALTDTESGYELARELALAEGATGFGGYVGATGNDGLFHPEVLFASYLSGFGMVESYYRALRYVGWRQLIVGDPLVAPFAGNRKAAIVEDCGIDEPTGLPGCFAKHRRAHLTQRYSSEDGAIDALMRAEALLVKGDRRAARASLEESAALNPFIPNTHQLLGMLVEEGGDYEAAFEHYSEEYKLTSRPELHRKLATLAFYKLEDPARARPHVLWLYAKGGSDDPEIVKLWAELNLKLGNRREAESAYNRLISSADSPPAFAMAGLGRMYWEQEDALRAEKFLEGALEAVGNRPEGSETGFDLEETRRLLAVVRASEKSASTAADPSVISSEDTSDRIVEAKVLTKTPLQYPDQAKTEGVQGLVILTVFVDEYGQFLKADLETGHPSLARAALESVKLWGYQPRMINGKRTPGTLTVILRFSLDS